MANILILGNGFDLAHNLPTSYQDFIDFIKGIDKIRDAVGLIQDGNHVDISVKAQYEKYLRKPEAVNLRELKKMKKLLQGNSWAHYFNSCHADIQGWIDLEREMLPVFKLFERIFDDAEYSKRYSNGSGDKEQPHISISSCPENLRILATLWPKYISKVSDNDIEISSTYCDRIYGIFEDKLLRDLKIELNNFVKSFCIYLNQIVNPLPIDRCRNQIESLKIDDIITFNYTKTYLKYDNLKKVNNIYHVHGCIDDPDSMIIGVNEVENDEYNKFIEFVKYFQRLSTKSDPGYHNIITKDSDQENHIYIYGHSLDISDKDILQEFIDNGKPDPADLGLATNICNQNKIEIFYYDDRDFDTKIINLINLLSSRRKVEQWLFDKTIQLIETV